MCFVIIFNSTAAAVSSQDDLATLKDISIVRQCGVLEGETIQLQATLSPSDAVFSSVEWSSSNPDIIECSESGRIKGIKAGEFAYITCKSKWNKDISNTIKVYCVKPLSQPVKSGFKNFFVSIYGQPSTVEPISTYLNFPSIFDIILAGLKVLLGMGAVLPLSANNSLSVFTTGSCTVYGQSGKWCYVRFNDTVSSDGFVQYTTLSKQIPSFLYINKEKIIVFSDGIARNDAVLTADYNGEVTWSVSDDKVIDFNKTTGQVTGKLPDTATITAKAGEDMVKKCKVYSVYKWPQSWSVTPSEDIQFYEAPYTLNKSVVQETNKTFHVVGDMGDSSAWCLVNTGSESSPSYHFAKIDDFSTKGTISQYNNLNWEWPVRNTKNGKEQAKKANYIYSPYGWRDTVPKRHQGIDITTGIADEIAGYDVVSAFSGTVIYRCDTYGYDWGYCVAIRSNAKDPVSNLQYVAVYMHLMNPPSVYEGQKVSQGDLLGYVGNTTTPNTNMGYHLHFEFNNQNSPIGETSGGGQTTGYGRKSYDYLVNPVFLYMDKYKKGEIDYNKGCAAETKYMKTFWYGNGSKIEEAS